MSAFDVNTTNLANTEFTGALDTAVVPVDEGEFTGVIEKFELRSLESKGKNYTVLEVFWNVDDEEQRQKTGRDKLTVRQSLFLDITDHGTLDISKGKNVGLGRLREALGQNSPSKPWSFGHIVGQVATVLVTQRASDNGEIFNEIRRVAKAQ